MKPKKLESISFVCPAGYKSSIVDGKKTLVFDERAEQIKEAFTIYLSTQLSLNQLAEYLQHKYGRPYARSTLHKVLKNPFYYGTLRYSGELYDHDFETLITKEQFDEVQKKMNMKATYKIPSKKIYYPYRRLITCEVCGTYAVPEKAKSWVYYKCTRTRQKHPHKPIRQDKITEALQRVIDSYKIDNSFLDDGIKVQIFFEVALRNVRLKADGSLYYEETKNYAVDLNTFFDYKTNRAIQSKAVQETIEKEYIGEHSELIDYCESGKTIDAICEHFEKEYTEMNDTLMDLLFSGYLIEDEGLWKKVKKKR